MISFGFWIAGLFGKTISQQRARRIGLWVGIPLIIIVLVLLAAGGKVLYDNGKRQQYQQARTAKVAVAEKEADRAADVDQAEKLVEVEAENVRLTNAMAEAKRSDPDKGKREVGPVQQSYFDNLPKRKQ